MKHFQVPFWQFSVCMGFFLSSILKSIVCHILLNIDIHIKIPVTLVKMACMFCRLCILGQVQQFNHWWKNNIIHSVCSSFCVLTEPQCKVKFILVQLNVLSFVRWPDIKALKWQIILSFIYNKQCVYIPIIKLRYEYKHNQWQLYNLMQYNATTYNVISKHHIKSTNNNNNIN